MDNTLTRRKFFLSLIATGIAANLPLPIGLGSEVIKIEHSLLLDSEFIEYIIAPYYLKPDEGVLEWASG